MAESSYFWDNTTVGDATLAPYNSDTFGDIFNFLFCADNTVQGVIAGVGNELSLSGVTSPFVLESGAAWVDGRFYRNTTTVSPLTVTPPGAGTRVDTIVLRRTTASQTVRAAVKAGTPGAPAMQQDATIWEIPLHNVSVTSAGVYTVTDVRGFLRTPMAAGYETSTNPGDDPTQTAAAWNTISGGVTVSLARGAWLVMGSVLWENSSSVAGARHARIWNSTSSVQVALGTAYSEAAVETKSIVVRPTIYTLSTTSTLALQFYALDAGDTVYGGSGTGLDREGTGLVALRIA